MVATSETIWLDELREALRACKPVHDRDFDDIYPFGIRVVSRTFWTPVRVALRAAELLVRNENSSVLDVGAGAGKFCIVGALSTNARFTGLEHRASLVTVAEDAAARVGAAALTNFVHGGLAGIEWERFDAFYFYNPFSENLYGRHDHLDDTVELSQERFRRDIDAVYRGLEDARPGARVVTYHGFGREFPPSYECQMREGAGSDVLELWVRSDGPRGARKRPGPEHAGPTEPRYFDYLAARRG